MWVPGSGMNQASRRASAANSTLIRLLIDLNVVEVEPCQTSFAERLGQFFDFSEAIRLSAVQTDALPSDNTAPTRHPDLASGGGITEEFLQVRRTLISAIVKSCAPGSSDTYIRLPVLSLAASIEMPGAYEPYHRFYLAHQRDIAARVRHLRSSVRKNISGASPALAQLTALDATLDDILWERTRKLFSTVPKLLQMRFEHLLNSHHQIESTQRIQSEQWIGQFCREMQMLLLAELDVQLQPVLGLIEAFDKEANRNQ